MAAKRGRRPTREELQRRTGNGKRVDVEHQRDEVDYGVVGLVCKRCEVLEAEDVYDEGSLVEEAQLCGECAGIYDLFPDVAGRDGDVIDDDYDG